MVGGSAIAEGKGPKKMEKISDFAIKFFFYEKEPVFLVLKDCFEPLFSVF